MPRTLQNLAQFRSPLRKSYEEEFIEFVLPHLVLGSRGPLPKLPLLTIFNYILKLLYIGCQWEELPIEKDSNGRPEIHYSRIYRMFRFWEAHRVLRVFALKFKISTIYATLNATRDKPDEARKIKSIAAHIR
jgi:hypothetical protein